MHLNFIILISTLLIPLIGFVFYVQDILLGTIIFDSTLFKLIFTLFILLNFFKNINKVKKNTLFSKRILIYSSYIITLLISIIYIVSCFNISIKEIYQNILNTHYYFILLIFPLLLMDFHREKFIGLNMKMEKKVLGLFIFISIVISVFSFLQFISNDLLLSSNVLEAMNLKHQYFLESDLRITSFFQSGWALGEVINFSFSIILSIFFLKNSTPINFSKNSLIFIAFFVIPLTLSSLILTLNRAGIIQFLLLFLGLFFLNKTKSSFFIFISIFIAFFIFLIITTTNEFIGSNYHFFNFDSIDSRINHWSNIIATIKVNFLFGTGGTVNSTSEYLFNVGVIDNFFLFFIYNTGIINFIFVVILILIVFSFTLKTYLRTKSLIWGSLTIFYFTIPFGSILMDQYRFPILLFFIIFYLSLSKKFHKNF